MVFVFINTMFYILINFPIELKEQEKIIRLKELLSNLPENNYNLMEFIFCLLHELSNKSEVTQMNAENLAKVISPNLIWKEVLDITDMSVVEDAMKGNRVTEAMIVNFELIFS